MPKPESNPTQLAIAPGAEEPPVFDAADLAILDALQRDGRISNKTLAAKARLSPSACLARVRKLQDSGAIRGFTAQLGRRQVGAHFEAWATITLTERRAATLGALTRLLAQEPLIVAAYELAAPFDVLAHIVGRDLEEWNKLELALDRSGLVASIRIGLALSEIKPASPWPIARPIRPS